MALSSGSDSNKKSKKEKEESQPLGTAGFLIETLSSLATAFIIFFLILAFIARPVKVDGSSMNPTLIDRDWLVVQTGYYSPEYGDIVIISRDRTFAEPLVKRIIGMPGDVINIDFAAGEVYRNGKLLDEEYIAEETHRMGDVVFPQTVPEHCYFVMGDNRNHSSDSRFSSIGFITEDNIMGKASFKLIPFGKL